MVDAPTFDELIQRVPAGDQGAATELVKRYEPAIRRDNRRVAAGVQDEGQFIAGGESPSVVVAARDLLQEVYRRYSPDERRLLDLRSQGYDWSAIASELGGGAEALRRRLSRALDRIADQPGLDDAP